MGTHYDVVGELIAYEAGELDSTETLTLFQYLVDNDMIKDLQGHYGRVAEALLRHHLIQPRKEETHGNN